MIDFFFLSFWLLVTKGMPPGEATKCGALPISDKARSAEGEFPPEATLWRFDGVNSERR